MRWFMRLGMGALAACAGTPPDGTDALDTDTDTEIVETDDTDGEDTDDEETDLPTDTVVSCGPVPAATSGVCDVTAGTTAAVWLRGTVLEPFAVLEGGSVLIDADGTIACVGCDCSDHPAAAEAHKVDCAEGVISPGLINAHDHITFGESAPLPHPSVAYDHQHGWRRGTNQLSASSNPSGLDGTRWTELRQAMAGTTSISGTGIAAGMLRNADRADDGDLTVVTFQTFPLGDSDAKYRPDCTWAYSHDTWTVANLPAWIGHVGIGVDARAAEEFRCLSSEVGDAEDLAQPSAAFAHAIGLDAVAYGQMATDEVELIWSPRSDLFLYGHTADVRTFTTLGGTLALGTDWTYTGSANVVRELACVDQFDRVHLDDAFTDADTWRMATLNAAKALGSPHRIGALVEGLLGDVAVFDGSARTHHRAVIEAGYEDVALVLRSGLPLVGETDTVTSMEHDCEVVDVCGTSQAVCVEREFGASYADLAERVEGAYPAFFCGVPLGEPDCVPARPGEFTGVSEAGDADGDGVPDGDDLCPAVFDPARPVDEGSQRDADGDGKGDACDPTPVGTDLDGDGAPNEDDVCPVDEDAAQLDADADGKGDVCDACPDLPNPDSVCGGVPMTISETWTADEEGLVLVEGVVVASKDYAMFGDRGGVALQDPTVVDGVRAGVWVLIYGPTGLAVGDRARVEGRIVVDRSEERWVGEALVTRLGTGTAPAPIVLTPAQAAAGDYDGVLATVTGTVSATTYDCTEDDNFCDETEQWEIGGPTGVLVDDRLYLGSDWAATVGDVPVTGILSKRFGRTRIQPRTDADFGP